MVSVLYFDPQSRVESLFVSGFEVNNYNIRGNNYGCKDIIIMYCNFSLLFCLCIICFADADRQLHERAMSKDHGCFGGLGDVS